MQYAIVMYTRGVRETKEEALENMVIRVNAYLSVGWELNGGLCVDQGTFYQAVKSEGTIIPQENN